MIQRLTPCAIALGLAFLNLSHADEKVATSVPKDHPNIVLILADDMSYDSVSAFNNELGSMQTPCIDRLVKEGLTFTDGHSASAVCTPTRYGLLTGRHCWRTRLKSQVLWPYGQPLLRDEEMTLPELLKQAGYQTGMIGKWHLGLHWKTKEGKIANSNIKDDDRPWTGAAEKIKATEATIDWSRACSGGPRDHGFDHWFGVGVPNFPPYIWIDQDKVVATPTIPKPKAMFGSDGLMTEGWKLEEILPSLRDAACEWITESAKRDEPYFLYMPLTSPHTPISPSKEFAGKTALPYIDFVIETDNVVGRVLDAIEKTGEAKNTLVIFSADNGTAAAANFKQLVEHGVNVRNNFRAHKASIYEGGHRVPFILRWPKQIKPGSRIDQTVCLNDFFATFAEMTGHKLKPSEGVDSISILPLITGKATALPDRPSVVSHSYKGQYAIRDSEWKLILPMKKGDAFQLYNLKQDQKETENLASQEEERVKAMTATLMAYVKNGRSTPGPKQQNHGDQKSWPGLPW